MPSLPTVLVTDGGQRAALAVTRSLGRAGYRVVVASSHIPCLAGVSRHAAASWKTPSPLHDPEGFIDALLVAAARFEPAVLLPIAEESIRPVLEHRDRFGQTRVPFPPLDVWLRITDKPAVLEDALHHGIAVPRQHVLTSGSEPPSDIPCPVVVKPARSVVGGPAARSKLGVSHAQDRSALLRIITELPTDAFPLLLQQRIVGPGLGVFLLLASGEPAAVFAHRRILEKPPSGGVSACSESVPLAPHLLEQSVALLRRFGWDGAAMVEYKLDRATGTPYLMEVNGRLWGSLQLAIDAGVDFPRLLVEKALGKPVPAVREWRIGVRCRWRLGEVDHFLARVRHSPKELSLPEGAPSLIRAFWHAVLPAWRPDRRGEVFRWTDPRPGIQEFRNWIRGR